MKTIPAREVAREFSRVRHDVERGESYEVTHRGRTVMRILPPDETPTVGDLVDALAALPHDESFGDDVLRARDALATEVTNPWDDR